MSKLCKLTRSRAAPSFVLNRVRCIPVVAQHLACGHTSNDHALCGKMGLTQAQRVAVCTST